LIYETYFLIIPTLDDSPLEMPRRRLGPIKAGIASGIGRKRSALRPDLGMLSQIQRRKTPDGSLTFEVEAATAVCLRNAVLISGRKALCDA